MSGEKGEVKVLKPPVRLPKQGSNYRGVTLSLKGKKHSSDSFDNLPQTYIDTTSVHQLSSFAAKLSLLLTRYKTYLEENKPLYFIEIWEIRKAQVNHLLGLLHVCKLSKNDKSLVDACRKIVNEKRLYPLGIFNRMYLPKTLRKLFDDHLEGKVNFHWAFLVSDTNIAHQCNELLKAIAELKTELESEKTAKEQLTINLNDLENLVDDKATHAELKREDVKQIMNLFETRPRSNSIQHNYDFLLLQYKKLDARNKELEADFKTVKSHYDTLRQDFEDVQNQLKMWEQGGRVETVISSFLDETTAKKAIKIINDQKQTIAERDKTIESQTHDNFNIRKTLSERQVTNMNLRRELDSVKGNYTKIVKQKDEEIIQLKSMVSKKDETILQLQQQICDFSRSTESNMKL